MTSELKNYGDIPKGNVELISNNIPVDLRVFEVNHILFSAYNVAGWWGRKEGPPSKYLDNKKYSVTYIFNDYKFDCDISIYLKNDLKKFERFKKFYIFNYKKYYKIDKVLKKC